MSVFFYTKKFSCTSENICYNEIKGGENIKTVEEIRQFLGIPKCKFAGMIGSTLRTYQGRLDGSQPKWSLEELINVSKMSNGGVRVDVKGKTYDVMIQEVKR